MFSVTIALWIKKLVCEVSVESIVSSIPALASDDIDSVETGQQQ